MTDLGPEGLPRAVGLYDPTREHDACGLGFVAHVGGVKSHAIIAHGLEILKNLEAEWIEAGFAPDRGALLERAAKALGT